MDHTTIEQQPPDPEQAKAADALDQLRVALANLNQDSLTNELTNQIPAELFSVFTGAQVSGKAQLRLLDQTLNTCDNAELIANHSNLAELTQTAEQLANQLQNPESLGDATQTYVADTDDSCDIVLAGTAIRRANIDNAADQEGFTLSDVQKIERFEDKYEVLKLMGEGGQGKVFLVFDKKLKRKRILKALHPHHLNDPTMVERFSQEGHEGSKESYNGVNIVGVIGFVDIAGVEELGYKDVAQGYGLVLEYIEGPECTDVIKEHNQKKNHHLETHSELNPELVKERQQLIDDFIQISWGIHHLHASGHYHRDIKPANGKYSSEVDSAARKSIWGTPFILDLGLVKNAVIGRSKNAGAMVSVLESQSQSASSDTVSPQLTQQGMFLGSASYISPEQAQNPSTVGPQADIYSLGCWLFEDLTGEKAQIPTATTIKDLFNQAQDLIDGKILVPDVRSIDPTVKPELAAIVAKMTAHDPRDRYQSVAEFIEDLEAYKQRDGRVVKAYKETTPKTWKERRDKMLYMSSAWLRRNPKLAAAITAGVASVSLLLTAIGFSNLATRKEKERSLGQSSAQITNNIAEGDYQLAFNGLINYENVARENDFIEYAKTAKQRREALSSILLINQSYGDSGISIINPLRTSAVKPQLLIETEKKLAWMIANPDQRPEKASDYKTPDNWIQNFAKNINAQFKNAGLNTKQQTEIKEKLGIMLFGLAADLSTPRLLIPRSEAEVQQALKIYEQIAELWGDKNARALALARRNAWSLSNAPEADEKIAALNAALDGRLTREKGDAISAYVEAAFMLVSNLEAIDYETAEQLLLEAQAANPELEDEYVVLLGLATAKMGQGEGKDFMTTYDLLVRADTLTNESTPLSLMLRLESRTRLATLFTPERLDEIIEKGLKRDKEGMETSFSVAYADFLSRSGRTPEALAALEKAKNFEQDIVEVTGRTTRNIEIYLEISGAQVVTGNRDNTLSLLQSLNEIEEVMGDYGTFGEMIAPDLYYKLASYYAYLALITKSDEEKFSQYADRSVSRLKMCLDALNRQKNKVRKSYDIDTDTNFTALRNNEKYAEQLELLQTKLHVDMKQK